MRRPPGSRFKRLSDGLRRALLGMVCLMAMGYSISAVTTSQANPYALGIRRMVTPLGRIRRARLAPVAAATTRLAEA